MAQLEGPKPLSNSAPGPGAPKRSGGMLPRPRLLDALRVLKPLTLVSAPAGYGKTVLVDSWISRLGDGPSVVHLGLNGDAIDPVTFWSTTSRLLRSNGIDLPDVPVLRADRTDLRSLARGIAAQQRKVIFVLDCGEFSLSSAVGQGLDRFLRRCSGRLALILLTRTDPPMPLHRYRLDGAITELRATDLAFTTAEVAMLVQREGLVLESSEISLLQSRTGGWAAGLRFAGLGLAATADIDEALRAFRGDSGNVAEYLLHEVLAKQSQETRQFLLRMCVVDELDPRLVTILTGRPCDLQALEVLAHRNAFIELVPGHYDRYRYHSLFREFLRGQLAAETPELVPGLHRLAAAWLAGDGQVSAAIRHASLAQDWTLAAELLVDRLRFAELLVGSKGEPIRDLLKGLPPDWPGSAAAIARAALSVSELDVESSALHLTAARRLVSQEVLPAGHRRGLAIAVLSALVASLGNDTDAGLRSVLAAEKALRLAPAHDVTALLTLSAVIGGCKGRILFTRGDLEAGAAAFASGVATAEAAHVEELTVELKGMSALVEAVIGRLGRATELALQVSSGVSGISERATSPGVGAATLALAWVRTEESEPERARDLLGQAERQLASYDSAVLAPVLSLLRARVLRSDGDFELALAELEGAGEQLSSAPFTAPGTGWLAESLVVGEATSLMALERHEEAVGLLQSFRAQGRVADEQVLHQALVVAGVEEPFPPGPDTSLEGAPLAVQVNSWLLLAEQSLRSQDPERSEEFLSRALRLAAPERLRRPFLEAGHDVRAFLERSGLSASNRWLRTRGPTDSPDTEESRLPQQRRPFRDADLSTTAVVIPLTVKESEVLAYLADLLTTDEIAATMFVSVNTVRSHVRSILRKLGVSRRNEAVRLAWDLGLLPPRGSASASVR